MKSSGFYTFINFIIFIKFLFFIFSVLKLYVHYKHEDPENPIVEWIEYWNERLEFIFIISMAIICIVLFNPFYKGTLVVDRHVQVLLFIYGFIILAKSNWETFFGEMPPWFHEFRKLL